MDLAVQIAPEFDEVEMGDWTNRTFAELDALPEWQRWNGFRSSTRPPSGESMQEVRQRVVTRLLGMQGQHSLVAIFSHGDAIRAALGYFLGQEIDHYARIEIDPGGLSLVELDGDWFRVRFMNAPAEGAAAINALVRADTKGY
jgi:probable phosphoglycerate mutase